MSAETHDRGPFGGITDDRQTDDFGATDETRALPRVAGLLFALLVVASVYVGWRISPESHLTAESGMGYALGIVGACLMVLMLSYSARKRFRFMRRLGAVRHWFRAHMILGVIAPVCILYHANFHLGSFNSNIALGSMLLVAASGLVGRFIYKQIHHGLYGARATLETLDSEGARTTQQLSELFPFVSHLQEELRLAETRSHQHPRGYLAGMIYVLWFGIWTRWIRMRLTRRASRALREASRREGWTRARRRQFQQDAKMFIGAYLRTCRKVVSLNLFDRLFALWHVVHLPFFAMMLVAATVHVVAVHLY